jgi:ribonucleoside-diphosphate reductase, alpha subunit
MATKILKNRESYVQETDFSRERFNKFLNEINESAQIKLSDEKLKTLEDILLQRIESRDKIDAKSLFDLIIKESNSLITQNSHEYSFFSAATFLRKLYKEASKERGFFYKDSYGDYYNFLLVLVEKGIYSDELIEAYTPEELKEAGTYIDKEKDKKFSYAGLFLLNKNYLAKGYHGETLELPQERFLTSALYLMKDEKKEQRMDLVKEAYWALSNHYVGLATPTLVNSGRPMGTLSSCHILTIGDSMRSIMSVMNDIAMFSQNGAGLGVYMGHLRANGSWIRGYKKRATGIVHPARLMSVLAEYVNQLGVRKGGIAAYLPVYHADIFDFLELRLKTGSQEKRAHSIFSAVCIPDEFMRRLNNRQKWTIFDPYEVKKVLGFDINSMYDKKKLKKGETPNPIDHEFTYHYRLIEEADLELSREVNATEIYKGIYESRKTGGTPYLYFIDTAARLNPNGHKGMPKGSNLCSEIIQNTSETQFISTKLDKDTGVVITITQNDGLVTCNLSSLVINNVFHPKENVDLQRVTDIQVRMLDNVIDANRTAVLEAENTNYKYRAIGAGALGLATHLADMQIVWNSDEAVKYVEQLFEKYSQAVILSSHKLAMEKGSYPYFEGSDWQTGDYFRKRGFDSPKWLEIKEKVSKGIRNAYLMAIAPTGGNSIIMNGSPSIDALYDVIYQEEKAGMNVTIVPVNYSAKTKWFYKSAFEYDELDNLKIIAAAQKYIDQGISHNMHIPFGTKASQMLKYDSDAWELGLKTIYYTYTRNIQKNEDCANCEA